jgi:hypothetical protein
MKSVPFLIALGALTVTLACEQPSPTGVPQPPPPPPPNLSTVSGVGPCSALPATSVTKVIGPAGGSISFGPHKLVVPSGALATQVSIKAVIPANGNGYNEVRLYPDGLAFRTTVSLRISYANCGLTPAQEAWLPYLKVVYLVNGTIVEYVPTVANLTAKTVTGALKHFSNYAVAW